MSLQDYKITDTNIAEKGVIAAPNKLTGTASENKAVFDRLIREVVKGDFNSLIDGLAGTAGAGEIGVSAIAGLTGANVQALLTSLKVLVDAKAAAADVTAALGQKADSAVTDTHFKAVSFDGESGIFTFTRENGQTVAVDTLLEKVVTNWSYDAATQSLVLPLADGTEQRVSLSDFVTVNEFVDSATIDFTVVGSTVTAAVKSGSITDGMLSSALVATLQGYVSAASGSATAASASEANALSYKQGAETARSGAEAAQAAAETAQSAAEDAEADAAGYAAAAAASAESASGSASAASAKAAEAAGSADTATAKANAADAAAAGQHAAAERDAEADRGASFK